jgi:hypothetical protein
MHTYEKPPVSGRRGPNYVGLIAVICLFTLMFATWALMRTNLGQIPHRIITIGMAPSAPADR